MDLPNLLTIAAALGLGAFAKGATGMGLPLIAVPILTSSLGLAHAISVLVIPIIATNAWQVWRFRGEYSASQIGFLRPMILMSIVGMVAGTFALAAMNERLLVLALSLTIFAYIALRLLRPDFILTEAIARPAAAPVGLIAGMCQGATGVSAPIAATFVHAMGLNYRTHVFALSALFLASTLAQVAALSASGILQWRWLAEGLFALLPIACFMPFGQRLSMRLSQARFDGLILAFLGIMGVFLVLDL